MEQHTIVTIFLFLGFFFGVTAFLQKIATKYSFPFTVSLLLAGFLTQIISKLLGLNLHLELTPEIIYYLLLPLLLFESALHIRFHQFKLQFKTITFLVTFGLLTSVFIVGFGAAYLLGLPLGVALLFGALISATDPIAVITLFKSLGAPKRLSLVAEGESMFNDATGVIAFRVISVFVLTNQSFETVKILEGTGEFIRIFIGSLIVGSIFGYIGSKFSTHARGDRLIQITITLALALFSFTAAEYFFHLSGVISTVMAGLVLGNLGKTKVTEQSFEFVNHIWEYIALICVAFVFFFAAFNLDFAIFTQDPKSLLIIIGLVLLARAVSVYFSAFLSNNLPGFKNEPNLPMSWQHILNWGGLRGVIPLVLVYSLPADFAYKDEFLAFTLSTLVFTLIVNGLTIRWLLLKLHLNIPKKEEQIISDEMQIFELENVRKVLKLLPSREFDKNIIRSIDDKLAHQINTFRNHLLDLAEKKDFLHSLKVQSLEIERNTMDKLYSQGRFSENVYFEFESMLDIQKDVLEYPELFSAKDLEGYIDTKKTFRRRIIRLKRKLIKYPILKSLFNISEEELVRERYGLLRARIFTSYAVLEYLKSVSKLIKDSSRQQAISEVRKNQLNYIRRNRNQIKEISKEYPGIVKDYQRNVINLILQSSILPKQSLEYFTLDSKQVTNDTAQSISESTESWMDEKISTPINLSKLIS